MRVKTLLDISALLLSSLACVTIMGKSPSQPNSPGLPATEAPLATEAPVVIEPPATEPPTENATCPAVTDQIMEVATSGSDSGSESKKSDEEVTLVTYSVSGDRITNPVYEKVNSNLLDLQNDSAAQQKVWNYFTALIPLDERRSLAEYSIMTDGAANTLAAVSQTQYNPDLWSLQVDIADTNNIYDLTYTFVHEFGHLLTLGPDQVPPSIAVFNNPDDNNIYTKEVAACPDYFPGEGCSKPNSYINAFYNQFWTNIYEEWNKINLEENDDAYYQKLDDFYAKYKDQFVTDYAVTNPEEDIAESWAFFVLGAKPAGNTIAEEKTLFFYQYPELVQLRQNILNNLCASFPK